MVAVKRERVEQLVEEEEAEEAEADAKKRKEKVVGKRRAIPDEEAEQGRPLQRMQLPRRQPLQTLMEPEDERRVEGEKIPTPPTAPDSTTMEPTTTCRPGGPRKSYPTSSLPQPPNACSTCMSFGITCEPVPGYVCKPCQTHRKGCEHSSCKRVQSASRPPPPPTAPPSSTMTPARGRSSTRLQTGASPPASPSQSEPPAKRQRRQSSSCAKTPTKTSTTPSRSTRAHARQASPQRRPVMHNATSNPPPCNLPTVIIPPLKTNGESALGATGGF